MGSQEVRDVNPRYRRLDHQLDRWRSTLPSGAKVVSVRVRTFPRFRKGHAGVRFQPEIRAVISHADAARRGLITRYPSLGRALRQARQHALRAARELDRERYARWLAWFEGARADNLASWNGAAATRAPHRPRGPLSVLLPGLVPLLLTLAILAGAPRPASAATPHYDGHVSGVAAVQGYEGTDWHTDLAIFNAGDNEATVRLYYAPKGESPSSFVPVTVDPKQTVFLEDIVATTFATSGSGAIQYEVLDEDPSNIVISADTYNRVSDTERYGQFVPGEEWGGNNPVIVPTAVDYDSYRTNLDVQLGPDTTQYRVVVKNNTGNVLHDETYTAAPGSWNQFSQMVKKWADGQLPGVYAEVYGVDGPISAATDIINNPTGDSAHVIGKTVSQTAPNVWITGAAHVDGANDSHWQSNMEIINPHDSRQAMSISYLPRDQENPIDSFMIQPYSLIGHEAKTFQDIVGDFLAQPNGSAGAIWVSTMPETPPIDFLQTLNNAGTDDQGRAVTYGQNVPAVNWDYGAAGDLEAVVAGVVDNANNRANLLLQNTRFNEVNQEFMPSDVVITLYDEDGNRVGQDVKTLRPGEYMQLNKFPEQWTSNYRGTVVVRSKPLGNHEVGGVNASVTVVNGNTVPGTNDAELIPHKLVNKPDNPPTIDEVCETYPPPEEPFCTTDADNNYVFDDIMGVPYNGWDGDGKPVRFRLYINDSDKDPVNLMFVNPEDFPPNSVFLSEENGVEYLNVFHANEKDHAVIKQVYLQPEDAIGGLGQTYTIQLALDPNPNQ